MTRRNALKGMLAALVAPLAWCGVAKAKSNSITIPVLMDRMFMQKQLKAMRDPDFIPEPEGVLGETYFIAGLRKQEFFFSPRRLFFDGVDVTDRAVECDAVGQWARMLDVDASGRSLPRRRTHYGRVEIRTRGALA